MNLKKVKNFGAANSDELKPEIGELKINGIKHPDIFNSQLSICNSKMRIGFTLAEVLITLVVIGVVAAITIPALISNGKNEEIKTQFKNAYSILTQAVNTANVQEFSGNAGCYYGLDGEKDDMSECRQLFETILQNLSISKKCIGSAVNGKCLPVYKSSELPSNTGGCAGFAYSQLASNRRVYVLSGGQILTQYSDGGGYYPMFFVDINGFKGPNKPGYDLFGFTIDKKTDEPLRLTVRQAGCNNAKAAGGRSTKEMMQWAFNLN